MIMKNQFFNNQLIYLKYPSDISKAVIHLLTFSMKGDHNV